MDIPSRGTKRKLEGGAPALRTLYNQSHQLFSAPKCNGDALAIPVTLPDRESKPLFRFSMFFLLDATFLSFLKPLIVSTPCVLPHPGPLRVAPRGTCPNRYDFF